MAGMGTFGQMAIFSFQMNKNMTSGERGCVVTNGDRLYRRWGRGCRMDELRAAVLRVQLRKLPAITAAMRGSKYRIRAALARFPQVRLRNIPDPAGDTGCFLITTYSDPQTGRHVSERLKAEGIFTYPQGISNVVITEWGLHLYCNIVSLVKKTSVASGFSLEPRGEPGPHPRIWQGRLSGGR